MLISVRALCLRGESHCPHLIFIALFPSSLVHLQQSITSLMKEKREVEVVPTTFDLLEVMGSLNPEIIAGAEITNSKRERTIFSRGSPFPVPLISNMFNELRRNREQQADVHVSRLFLRPDEPRTDITLSSDGVITFNNPDLTIGEIVYLISQVTNWIPVRVQERENLRSPRETKREVRFYEEE
jgi:hypothetical protein